MPDPWAVVATKPAQQSSDDQWSVKATRPAEAAHAQPPGDWRDPFTKVHLHGDDTSDIRELMANPFAVTREVGKTFANIGAGGLSAILHPVDTVVGMGKMFDAALTGGVNDPGKMIDLFGPTVQSLIEHPVETVEQGVGQTAVMDAAGEVVGPATRALKDKVAKAQEGTRTAVQSAVGTGEKAVKTEVGKEAVTAGKAAKTTEENNRAVLSKHEDDLREAGRKNINAHVQWLASKADTEKANALADKAVEEHNRAQSKEYQRTLDDAGRSNLKAHIKYLQEQADTAKENALAAKATEEKNLAESTRYESELAVAQRENTNAHVQYLVDKAEADQANAAAKSVPDARAGIERTVTETSAERQKLIEKAEKNAKADLDKRYEDQRELLGDELIPDTYKDGAIVKGELSSLNVGERTVDAYQAFQTNPDPTLPKEIKEIHDRAGEQLGWRQLQGLRSKLTKQLSSGRLNGEVYQGYKAALGVIDDGLQKIADNMGVGDQVRKNRADYAHYMQTFHDPISEPNTVARKTQTTTSPDFVRSSEEAERRKNLDVYDPNIGKLGTALDSLNQRLSSLPSDATRPTAKLPQYPEEKSVKPPTTVKPPEPKAGPEYPDEKTVEPPKSKPPAEHQDTPDYPEETTVGPPKTNPIDVPDVNTRDIRGKLFDRWISGEEKLDKYQVKRLLSGGAGAFIGHIFGGGEGAAIGAVAGATFGPMAVAKLLDHPAFREWITRPPAGELETLQNLPYADRIKITDGLKKAVTQAQKQGITVDPRLATLVGVGTAVGPHTKRLRELADQSQ